MKLVLDEWGIARRPTQGLGYVWPSQVLDYTQMWTPFVEGTVSALRACAASTSDPKIAKQTKANANSLESLWHAYDNYDAFDFMNNAPAILANLQQAIFAAGLFTRIAKPQCPSVSWPPPAPLDHQNIVIAALQNAQYVAVGELELLVAGADGALVAAGNVASTVANKIGGLADAFATPWPWIAITAVGSAVIIYYVYPRKR